MSGRDIAQKSAKAGGEVSKYSGCADYRAEKRFPQLAAEIEKTLDGGGDIFTEPFARRILTDEEVRLFCGVAAAVVMRRLKVCSGNREPLETLLAQIAGTDVEELCRKYSPLERKLSSYPGYAEGDGATRSRYRENCRKYAKKHDVSEEGAAAILGEDAGKPDYPKYAGILYFCVRFALLVGLLLLSWSLCGLLAAVLLVFPLSETARTLCDFVFSRILPQKTLPMLRDGEIPDSQRTLCVVTTLLCDVSSADETAKRLESYCLCCREREVAFGILADFRDSKTKNSASDEEIAGAAKKAVERLSAVWGRPFYLFLRPRVYAPTEGKYMGKERKRGAVIALTRLICGKSDEFTTVCGDREFLSGVKYVITLDADTGLFGDEAKKLIKTAAHPCNRPVVHNGIVADGYAIIQPRIGLEQLSAYRTRFSELIAGDSGREIYAHAGYDLWQNLFGEGSFCGKGIFDVRAFSLLIDGAFPDGRILSHDLLEGTRLRAGYAGNIVLYDGVPKTPASYYKRLHRWIRGDVAAVFFGSGVSALSKYKLCDNLRRILCGIFTPVCVLYSAFVGGYAVRGNAIEWGAAAVVLLAVSYMLLPPLLGVMCRTGNCLPSYGSFVTNPVLRPFGYMLWELCSAFHQGLISLDAAFRSLWRTLISGRRLLEWTTAAEGDKSGDGFLKYAASMWGSVFAGVLLLLSGKPLCVLFGILWLSLPAISSSLSKSKPEKKAALTDSEKKELEAYASGIWKYFSENVGENTAYLPPDFVTEGEKDVPPKTAMRTSPTDIGLYLVSAASAYDFGFITQNELNERVGTALTTLEKIEKSDGHLFNWYSLPDLRPTIRFVSTVDSGNLAVCLTALAGMRELAPELSSRLRTLAHGMNFTPLYDPTRGLFRIGSPTDETNADSRYDHYMSECRLASYYSVSTGAVPWRHWDTLGRRSSVICGRLGMRSWSGAAFEYFMPELFLPAYKTSLEYQALTAALLAQRSDCVKGLWGRSECSEHTVNSDGDYVYHSRGSRLLGEDDNPEVYRPVIAPYAAFLTAPFSKKTSLENLGRIKERGMYGRYGLYESLDLRSEPPLPVRCHMAHHLGMSLCALANARFDMIHVRRFISDPEMACGTFLLREMLYHDGIRSADVPNVSAVRRNCK